jgi:hypothetical protein
MRPKEQRPLSEWTLDELWGRAFNTIGRLDYEIKSMAPRRACSADLEVIFGVLQELRSRGLTQRLFELPAASEGYPD